MTEVDRVTVQLFNEIKISEEVSFDKGREKIMGPHSYVQVVIAHGLVGGWKRPFFYDFDTNISSTILKEIITELENAGFPVIATVSDMGLNNMKLWKDCGICSENTFIVNPANSKHNVYFFADTPHLLKFVRNNFIAHCLIYNDVIINKQPVIELLSCLKESELRVSQTFSRSCVCHDNKVLS
jgi:hypothetical protein